MATEKCNLGIGTHVCVKQYEDILKGVIIGYHKGDGEYHDYGIVEFENGNGHSDPDFPGKDNLFWVQTYNPSNDNEYVYEDPDYMKAFDLSEMI